jgi:integrase
LHPTDCRGQYISAKRTSKHNGHASRYRRLRARADELVCSASEANRRFLLAQVEQRRNEGQKDHSILNWLRPNCRFDAFLLGKPFQEAEPADYIRFLGSIRVELAPRSLQLASTQLKTSWRDLHNEDHLPRDFRKALMVKVPRDAPAGQLVSDQDFQDLLLAAEQLRGGSRGVPSCITATALLWTLMDAGLRIHEAVGLLVGDVELLPDGRAYLHLRADGRELKTGPRVVPIYLAVPALKALLAVHPHDEGDSSPLFLNLRNRGGDGRMAENGARRLIYRLAQVSGVNDRRPWDFNVTPHDFRHTCATKKARLGWNVEDLKKFFGWTSASRMAAHYVHLNYEDIGARVAKDLGLVIPGVSVPAIPPELQSLVRELVAQELARR